MGEEDIALYSSPERWKRKGADESFRNAKPLWAQEHSQIAEVPNRRVN